MEAGSHHTLEDANSCSLNLFQNNPVNTSAQLGPLQDNGGKTWTHAITPSSPAHDHVAQSFGCPHRDQRDEPRSSETLCDAGAYEFRPTALGF